MMHLGMTTEHSPDFSGHHKGFRCGANVRGFGPWLMANLSGVSRACCGLDGGGLREQETRNFRVVACVFPDGRGASRAAVIAGNRDSTPGVNS